MCGRTAVHEDLMQRTLAHAATIAKDDADDD